MGPTANTELSSKEYQTLKKNFEIMEMNFRHQHAELLDRVILLELMYRNAEDVLDQLKYNLIDCQYIDYKRLATDANYEKILENLFDRAKTKLLGGKSELEDS